MFLQTDWSRGQKAVKRNIGVGYSLASEDEFRFGDCLIDGGVSDNGHRRKVGKGSSDRREE